MSTMRRRPGGTKYLPVYNEEVKVFDASRCLLEEQVRRRMIEGYKVFLRVFVNGMRVCDTDPQLLSFPKFRAQFDRRFTARRMAEDYVAVYEKLISRKLATERLVAAA